MADGDYYSNRQDLDRVYGKNNIDRWADLDNDGNEYKIANQVDWANEQAKIYLDGRLTDGAYDSSIPFGTVTANNVPPLIRLLSKTLAGLYLFDHRRVIDSSENTDSVSQQRKNFDSWISQLTSGILKLRDINGNKIQKDSKYAPFNVEDVTGVEEVHVISYF